MKIIFFFYLYFLKPLLVVMLMLNKKIRLRAIQEKQSYKNLDVNRSYDYVVEVSSEGELEQALPFLKEILNHQQTILVFYCSKSVEAKLLKLTNSYEGLLYIHLLPLTTFFWSANSFSRLAKAKNLLMVRYDLFPELLFYFNNFKKRTLISATFVNKGKLATYFYKKCCLFFDVIIPVTKSDRDKLLGAHGIEVAIEQDARIIQVRQRVDKSSQTLRANGFDELDLILQKKFKKVILGSCYLEDIELLSMQLVKENHFFLCPHNLDNENIQNIFEKCQLLNSNTIIVNHINDLKMVDINTPQIIIITLKGILCELYHYFNIAYVGGGFNRSIHSVIEPFIAGCRVVCGPKTFRSTEYLFIQERCKELAIKIESSDELAKHIALWVENTENKDHHNKIKALVDLQYKYFQQTVSGILDVNK